VPVPKLTRVGALTADSWAVPEECCVLDEELGELLQAASPKTATADTSTHDTSLVFRTAM
jgi:hypothetical protein